MGNCLLCKMRPFCTFPFKSSMTRDWRPLCSSPFILVLNLFNNWHHLFTFSASTAPSPCTSPVRLWISTGQAFFAFKNHISDCTSQAAGFPDWCLLLRTTANGGKKLWHHIMQYMWSLDRKKMTNPHRKCVHNLHGLYMQLVYTFWMHLVNYHCP